MKRGEAGQGRAGQDGAVIPGAGGGVGLLAASSIIRGSTLFFLLSRIFLIFFLFLSVEPESAIFNISVFSILGHFRNQSANDL